MVNGKRDVERPSRRCGHWWRWKSYSGKVTCGSAGSLWTSISICAGLIIPRKADDKSSERKHEEPLSVVSFLFTKEWKCIESRAIWVHKCPGVEKKLTGLLQTDGKELCFCGNANGGWRLAERHSFCYRPRVSAVIGGATRYRTSRVPQRHAWCRSCGLIAK